MSNRISPELIQAMGGDWSGLGELTGPQLLQLLQDDKVRVVFANDGVLLNVETAAQQHGTYVLKHSDIQSAAQGNRNDVIHSIDISNYQPTAVTPAGLKALIAQFNPQPTHIVVRLSIEYNTIKDIAIEQIKSTIDIGCTVGGYHWVYTGHDQVADAQEAWSLFERAGVPVAQRPPVMWMDIEPYTNGSLPTVPEIKIALETADGLVQSLGGGGIYTGPWVWQRQPTNEFAGRWLWNASYDGSQGNLNLPPLGQMQQVGHQYTSTPLDRNVFYRFATQRMN